MRQLRNSSYIFFTSAFSGILLSYPSVAHAVTLWNTLEPNSGIAVSSQLDVPTEAADDFTVTGNGFRVTDVSFLGLFTDANATIDDIDLAFYNVFPGEITDETRDFATVRENGPADEEFAAFSLADNLLSFTTTDLGSFTVDETIIPSSGPNAPGVGSGVRGGALTGNLRQINARLVTPLELSPQAVFLVAAVDPSAGDYFWVGGARPPIFPDLQPPDVIDRQAWFRTNAPFLNALEPDWVRVSDALNQEDGTADPAFNTAFQVNGEVIPEPSSALGTLAFGALGVGAVLKRQIRNKQELG